MSDTTNQTIQKGFDEALVWGEFQKRRDLLLSNIDLRTISTEEANRILKIVNFSLDLTTPTTINIPQVFALNLVDVIKLPTPENRVLTAAEILALNDTYILMNGILKSSNDHPDMISTNVNIAQMDALVVSKNLKRPKYLNNYRPDLYVEQNNGGTIRTGFNDDWITKITTSQYNTDVQRFTDAGYTIQYANWIDTGFQARMQGLIDAGTPPLFYLASLPASGTVAQIVAVAADMTNSAYRTWKNQLLTEQIAVSGTNGIILTSKAGWWAFEMTRGKALPVPNNGGGPLSQTQYAKGVYEQTHENYLLDLYYNHPEIKTILNVDSTQIAGNPWPQPTGWYSAKMILASDGEWTPVNINDYDYTNTIIPRLNKFNAL